MERHFVTNSTEHGDRSVEEVIDKEKRNGSLKMAVRLAFSGGSHGSVILIYGAGTTVLTAAAIRAGILEDADSKDAVIALGSTLALNYGSLFWYNIQNLRLVEEKKIKTSPHFILTSIKYGLGKLMPTQEKFVNAVAMGSAIVPSMAKDVPLAAGSFQSNELLTFTVAANVAGAIVNTSLATASEVILRRVKKHSKEQKQ